MNRLSCYAVLLVASLCTVRLDAGISWNIWDQSYGNGPGCVDFSVAFDYTNRAEGHTVTCFDDYVTIASEDSAYFGISIIAGMPTDDSDVTLEFRIRDNRNSGIAIYMSENPSNPPSHWNHLPYLNRLAPDTVLDHNLGSNLSTPDGFSGEAFHTYRFVRANHVSYFFLVDDTPYCLGILDEGRGSEWDHVAFMLGIPGWGGSFSLSYLRIASGAYLPDTPAVPAPGAFLLTLIGLLCPVLRPRRRIA